MRKQSTGLEPLISRHLVVAKEVALAKLRAKEACTSFMNCLHLSQKHSMKVKDILQIMEEYRDLDIEPDGTLSISEFKKMVCAKCQLDPNQPIPQRLLHSHHEHLVEVGTERVPDANLTVDDFVTWWKVHALDEELIVMDPKEKQLRHLAREQHRSLQDVENLRAIFTHCGHSKGDTLDITEFGTACTLLTGRTPSRREWLEANPHNLPGLDFYAFATWYLTMIW